MKVINLLINPKSIKSSVLPGNVAMLLLKLGWPVQLQCKYLQRDPIPLFLILGYFLWSTLWCPKSYLFLHVNFEKKSSIICGEPEAQLTAEEEDSGRSKSTRKKKKAIWRCCLKLHWHY